MWSNLLAGTMWTRAKNVIKKKITPSNSRCSQSSTLSRDHVSGLRPTWYCVLGVSRPCNASTTILYTCLDVGQIRSWYGMNTSGRLLSSWSISYDHAKAFDPILIIKTRLGHDNMTWIMPSYMSAGRHFPTSWNQVRNSWVWSFSCISLLKKSLLKLKSIFAFSTKIFSLTQKCCPWL